MIDRLIADLAADKISIQDAMREMDWIFDKAQAWWEHARTHTRLSKESIESLAKTHKSTTILFQTLLLLSEGKGFTIRSVRTPWRSGLDADGVPSIETRLIPYVQPGASGRSELPGVAEVEKLLAEGLRGDIVGEAK